jgi:hypothetical protein
MKKKWGGSQQRVNYLQILSTSNTFHKTQTITIVMKNLTNDYTQSITLFEMFLRYQSNFVVLCIIYSFEKGSHLCVRMIQHLTQYWNEWINKQAHEWMNEWMNEWEITSLRYSGERGAIFTPLNWDKRKYKWLIKPTVEEVEPL